MKRLGLMILSIFMIVFFIGNVYALPAEDFPETVEGVEVRMILAAQNKQPHPTFTTEKNSLDTVWIFCSDETFRQYVIMDEEVLMYSCGTYTMDPDGWICIDRTQKYMEGAGTQTYRSVHGYRIRAEEYRELTAADSGESVAAVLESAEEKLCWIFYTDGTFDQYDVSGMEIQQSGSGTFDFETDGNGFGEQTSIQISYSGQQQSIIEDITEYAPLFIYRQ